MERKDADLIEESLELAAESCEDPAPEVFKRFFEHCPEARQFFSVLVEDQPPVGCGQMCFEAIQLVQDLGAGKLYVPDYMRQLADSHGAMGVNATYLYEQFLAAEVIAALAGSRWRAEHAAAWGRQSAALIALLVEPIQDDRARGAH